MTSTRQDLGLTSLVVISAVLIVSLMVSAIAVESVEIQGYSAVAYCAVIIFGIQWLSWLPASLRQTERFYDLTGGFTYLIVVIFSLWAGARYQAPGPREIIVSLLVIVWALRLSRFLFLRIHHSGKDGRFDDLKTSATRFLVPWTLQGLWVFITMNVVIVLNSQATTSPPLGLWDLIGLVIWVLGFGIEIIADNQKSAFNAKPENEGKWIEEGLWSVSRHPNYLGEILLWTGIACFGIPCFTGLEYLSWVSPLFVYLLLTKISGVPILDRRGFEKWGEDPGYLEYRSTTPVLFPSLKRK